jgi:hypothetical protein
LAELEPHENEHSRSIDAPRYAPTRRPHDPHVRPVPYSSGVRGVRFDDADFGAGSKEADEEDRAGGYESGARDADEHVGWGK